MSNLSDFFGGGGPSNIIRGSTTFESAPASPNSTNRGSGFVTVSTGVFVDPANTFLTQGCRGDVELWSRDNVSNSFEGSGSARITGSGEIVITSGIGAANSFAIQSSNPIGSNFTRSNAIMKGVVDWEAIEYG